MLFHSDTANHGRGGSGPCLPLPAVELYLSLTLDQDRPVSDILERALEAEPRTRDRLMRLCSPITMVEYHNDFVERCERALDALGNGRMLALDVHNLHLLSAGVRECLAQVSSERLHAAWGMLAEGGIFLDESTWRVLTEAKNCLAYYTGPLSRDMQALVDLVHDGTALGVERSERLASGLMFAVFGVGSYYGAPVVAMLECPEGETADPAARLEQWTRTLGRPAGGKPVAGSGVENVLNVEISELTPVDLGSTWDTVAKRLPELAPREAAFLLRARDHQCDFHLLYTGALLCSTLDDLDRSGIAAPDCPLYKALDDAHAALYDAHQFAAEVSRLMHTATV